MSMTSQARGRMRQRPTCRLIARDHAARVRDTYIALHEDFSNWTPSEAFRHTFRMSALAELRRRVTTQATVRVLEVGCGHGTWTQEIYEGLAAADERIEYVGIDFTEPRIELARRRLADHPSARFLVADCEAFEPCASFDVILGIEVISHVRRSRYAAWLERWRDWLSAGGTVIIIDKDRFSRHARRVRWDALKRRWLPRSLLTRTYYFPEHYGDYAETLYYPRFRSLRRIAAKLGYHPRPLLDHGLFRALLLDKPRP